jgi:hypothetical protein
MCKSGLQGKSANQVDGAEDGGEEGAMGGVGGVGGMGGMDGGDLDSVEIAHGFRSLHYDANDGFFLNKGKNDCCVCGFAGFPIWCTMNVGFM